MAGLPTNGKSGTHCWGGRFLHHLHGGWTRHPLLHCFGIELIAVGFDYLVLTSIRCSMVACVVVGINGCLKSTVSPLPVCSMWPRRLPVV